MITGSDTDKEEFVNYIALSGWNEYIADDTPPGPIPCGVTLEIMQIVTSESYKDCPVDGFPTGLKACLTACSHSIKCRLFWRLKK